MEKVDLTWDRSTRGMVARFTPPRWLLVLLVMLYVMSSRDDKVAVRSKRMGPEDWLRLWWPLRLRGEVASEARVARVGGVGSGVGRGRT